MKVVIAGGGTGGHLFPGIAVAEEFKRRDARAEITFIGTARGLEAKVVPMEGYKIRFISAEGYLGKSPIRKAVSLLKLLSAITASRAILKSLAPDIVIGTGGYVSVGPVVSARLLSIPSLVMEQNLVPGLANRMLSRVADAVTATYHESVTRFPGVRIFFTGNPVRKSILKAERASALGRFSLDEERLTVFVFGGSTGARSINNAVTNALGHLLPFKGKVQFLHQTGRQDCDAVGKAYSQLGFKAAVLPFIYQMADAYAASDLVISRAGATTLAELTALGKPAILIPYLHAGGHQEFNARKLAAMGACRLIPEQELGGRLLAGVISELLGSEETLLSMSRQARALGRPDAAQKVVDIAMSLINNRKPGGGAKSV